MKWKDACQPTQMSGLSTLSVLAELKVLKTSNRCTEKAVPKFR